MKRTWKVWIAAIFGLGISQPVVGAAETAPTEEPAVAAEKAPAGARTAGSGTAAPAPVINIPNGSEYLQAGGNPPRMSPYAPMPYYGPSQPWCPPNPFFPSQPQPYPYPYPYPSPNPNPSASPIPQMPAGGGGGAGNDTSFQSSQRGTEASQTNSPNLFGDLFGARASVITLPGVATVTMPGILNGRNGIITAHATPPIPSTPPGGTVRIQTPAPAFVTVQGFPQTVPVILAGSPIVENVTGIGVIPNSPNAARIQSDLNGYFAPGTPGFTLASAAERQANPQATLTALTFGPVIAQFNGGELIYTSQISDTVTTTVPTRVRFSVPTPGAGGVVGLLKVSEDNSPFPRDRVIFTYDYFNNVPMGAGGLPVNRYQFGFEKTFFEGRMSFEVRVPFASTLSSNSPLNGEALGTEFGNVRLLSKLLFLRGNKFNFSGGLGVSLPTADDIAINDGAGSELIHINNKSVQLAPFLAAIYTPNDRFFAQAWYGFTFDTGGNAVTVNPAFFGVGPNIGSLNSPSLMTVDGQIGYWVYQSETGRLRGVAPFLELHYAGDVGKGTLLNAGNGFLIGDVTAYNEFNLSTGVTTRIGQNTTLAVGAAVPLLGQSERTFDYQIGVRLNWYFGYTAKQRANATPNSF